MQIQGGYTQVQEGCMKVQTHMLKILNTPPLIWTYIAPDTHLVVDLAWTYVHHVHVCPYCKTACNIHYLCPTSPPSPSDSLLSTSLPFSVSLISIIASPYQLGILQQDTNYLHDPRLKTFETFFSIPGNQKGAGLGFNKKH